MNTMQRPASRLVVPRHLPKKGNNAYSCQYRHGHRFLSSSFQLPGGYYKHQRTPAAKPDLGLNDDQEKLAQEIHSNLLVFDLLAEVSVYDGFVDNMFFNNTKSSTVTPSHGSLSIGNRGFGRNKGSQTPSAEAKAEWWSAQNMLEDIAFVHRWIREDAKKANNNNDGEEDRIKVCVTADDVRQVHSENKVGIMLDVQNTEFLHKDLDQINVFYELGLRRIQLTYNFQNLCGTGCMEAEEGFVTRHGKQVIQRMNELGMVVDTGHASSKTVLEAVEASTVPIACSHAGMKSRCPTNPRTQTDEAIKAVADSGGIFGIVSTPGAITGKDVCTVQDYVDTIDAAVQLIGNADHVGFGSDFCLAMSVEEIFTAPEWGPAAASSVGVNVEVWPWSDGHVGFENNTGYINLTRGLVAKGYSKEDIAGIMGGNYLRFMDEIMK